MAPRFKPNLAIMHPLPRRNEIDRQLDTDPRARYFAQVQNGMWMRAAMIAYVFNVDASIIDHYQSHFAH
jgi:aspartate carbamoyltransferase catalytic subunit